MPNSEQASATAARLDHVKVLVSPKGERYVRISRETDRTNDASTRPSDRALVDHVTPINLIFQLPSPTDNTRADNEDSFQGPVTALQPEIR